LTGTETGKEGKGGGEEKGKLIGSGIKGGGGKKRFQF